MALQHLRSSTANKRPTPAAMSDGQLALNSNLASPGLFLKDSNGDLVKVGPVHVGTTAPNVTPAAGGQAGNSKGEQWLDTSSSRYVFKIWDGTDWRTEDGEFVNTSGDTMTGALGIIAGTNTAPGVFFSGDTNTGLYSTGADAFALTTGGTGRVFLDSSGRTGFGVASPSTRIDLSGNYSQNVAAVAALDIDCSAGNYFTKTISANSTFTVSNVPASRAYSFTLELTHTSGTVTWFSGVEFPGGTTPALTTGKTHLFMFVTDDGGTRWRGAALVNYTN